MVSPECSLEIGPITLKLYAAYIHPPSRELSSSTTSHGKSPIRFQVGKKKATLCLCPALFIINYKGGHVTITWPSCPLMKSHGIKFLNSVHRMHSRLLKGFGVGGFTEPTRSLYCEPTFCMFLRRGKKLSPWKPGFAKASRPIRPKESHPLRDERYVVLGP